METELKPCPFCGKPFVLKPFGRDGRDTRFEHDSSGECPLNEQDWQIIGLSIEKMTAALNTRPIEDAQAAALAALRQENEALKEALTEIKGIAALLDEKDIPDIYEEVLAIHDTASAALEPEP